uniref:Uncharacterized protein n=1 Tax=viral metagenome TaxID=1070528 RepID=A0A6C0CB25_9ZZZZ
MSFQGSKQVRTDTKSVEMYQRLVDMGMKKVTPVDLDALMRMVGSGRTDITLQTFEDFKKIPPSNLDILVQTNDSKKMIPSDSDLDTLAQMSDLGITDINPQTFEDFKSFKSMAESKNQVVLGSEQIPMLEKKQPFATKKKRPTVPKKKRHHPFKEETVQIAKEEPVQIAKEEPVQIAKEEPVQIAKIAKEEPVQKQAVNEMKNMISTKIALWERMTLRIDDCEKELAIQLMIANFRQILDELNKL